MGLDDCATHTLFTKGHTIKTPARVALSYYSAMKFAEDHNKARYKITAYDANSIGVNGKAIEAPLILSPMEILLDWKPKTYADLVIEDLEALYQLQEGAEVILIGTGQKQVFPDKSVLKYLTQQKIGFEIMDSQAACRTFNIIMAEGRTVVAGLFIE